MTAFVLIPLYKDDAHIRLVTVPCVLSLSRRGTIWNLYSVPRIAEPVWLTMMSSTLEKTQLCQRFLKEFTLLIEQINKNQ